MFNLFFLATLLLFTANGQTTLKAASASGWGGYVGTEMNSGNMAKDEDYKNKAKAQYSMTVAEYECKFGAQWAKGQWNWSGCDTIYQWAISGDDPMAFRFHALIWGIWNPEWFQDNHGGSGAAYLRGQMEAHIKEAMTHYKDVLYWDVVNEAIKDPENLDSNNLCYGCDGVYKTVAPQLGDNGEVTGWVANRWMDINTGGGDYVKEAFILAAKYKQNSNAKLFYNDYNILSGGSHYYEKKSTAVYNMIKGMKAEGVEIDGIGFQAHISATDEYLNYDEIKANFDRFAELGLEIHVTEIDVKNPKNDNDKLAEVYKMVLDACMDTSACKAFVSWGYTDKYTWIEDGNHPLPFDEYLNAKKTVYTLIDALQSGSGSSSSGSSGSGSSGSSGSSPGTLINWEGCNQYWYEVNVVSDYWVSKVEVQGASWGSTWSSCSHRTLNQKNVWGCGREGSYVFTDLPLNVRITDRDGKVSNSYYVITNLNEGSTYYMNSFSSSYEEDSNGFLADSNYTAAEVIVIIIFILIGLGCVGIIGYFVWKKYKNEKFDRKQEDKMMSVQQDTPRDNEDSAKESNEMASEEVEIDVDIEETEAANTITAN